MEKSLNLLRQLETEFECKEVDVRAYSPLTLAYIGDAVFEIIIRTVIVERGNRPVNSLHKSTIQYVNATTQAQIIDSLLEELTEEELAVYRRGKNAKSYTMAKNASIIEYKKATGLEALVGYLYLLDKMERVIELVKKGLHNAKQEL